jgi:cytochrome c oxidase subunit 2
MKSLLVRGVVAAAVMAAIGACGTPAPNRALSAAAEAGRDIAISKGCTACHGNNGEGGVGPAWVGLFGSTVELTGGATAIADEQYLRQSITDPEAAVAAGFTVSMPKVDLTDDQVDAIIDYIEELGE